MEWEDHSVRVWSDESEGVRFNWEWRKKKDGGQKVDGMNGRVNGDS